MWIKNEQNDIYKRQISKKQITDMYTQFNEIIRRPKTKSRITMEQLKQLIESNMVKEPWSTYAGGPTAPVGIGVYGIDKNGSPFVLTADAVRGEVDISPDVQTEVYNYYSSWSPRLEDLASQLNAHVVAKLEDGTTQYYWPQNIVSSIARRRKLTIFNCIYGDSHIDNSNVKGSGKVYITALEAYYKYTMPEDIPPDNVELDIWTYVDKGKIIIEFHVNGRVYDEVTITPIVRRNGRLRHIPAVSAHIAVAPVLAFYDVPLNLELVVGGLDDGYPFVILRRGRISLELYIHKNGAWVPPPSAWSIGYATYERSYARAIPQGVGSVVVEPGKPSLQPLW